MQVFGEKGWVEVGDVEHLTTWQMRVCFVDRANLKCTANRKPSRFPRCPPSARNSKILLTLSREKRLAVAGGDEAHGVEVLQR